MKRKQALGFSQRAQQASAGEHGKQGYLMTQFKSYDMFSERFRMRLDDGEDHVSSFSGAVCTVIMLLGVVLYAYLKLDVLLNKKDVTLLARTDEFEYMDIDNITHANGFNIAVGFTSYDNSTAWQLDSTYGELVFNSYSWGLNLDGSYYLIRKELEKRNCTKAELGLTDKDGETVFLPIHETNRNWLDLYHRKLQCLNREDLWLHGDFDSVNARAINVQLRKCHGRPDCKNESEILQFFREKYIIILQNSIRFDARYFGQEAIIPESRFKWLRVNTQSKLTYPYKIRTTRL